MTKEAQINLLDDRHNRVKQHGDRLFAITLSGMYVLGFLFAFEYGTFSVAASVGTLCLAAYFGCRWLLPAANLYQYVGSAALAVFTAQFIYQMHGMAEMHFFVFIGAAVLVVYQDWRLQLPNILLVVVHHAVFAYLQYAGNDSVYFTQQEYMDLKTFVIHALLAVGMVCLCGYWSFVLKQHSRDWETHEQTLTARMENLQKNIAFADVISQGDLEAAYEVTNDHDVMGKSLLKMKENLLAARANERRERFINTGLAQMGDILRSGSDIETLSYQIISGLVKYLQANQGGLFILESEGESAHLQLAACYAYERRKHLQKRIEVGEGLVGQAVLEGDKLYLTDVPADYVNITSGLGKATPRCILVVPLKANEQVEGVIELASFRPFEAFEVDFVEKLAESIALAIRDQKTNTRTRSLLEQSQVQAEALRAQEEEMRQNMEEMVATQEELARREAESAVLVSALDQSLAAIRFDAQGIVETANEIFLQTMGYSLDEIQGRHHRMFVAAEEAKSAAYEMFWERLRRGEQCVGEVQRITKSGKALWLSATYTSIKDAGGTMIGVIKLARDISTDRETRDWLEQQAEQLREQEGVLRYTLEDLVTAQEATQAMAQELAAARLEIERLQAERTERAN